MFSALDKYLDLELENTKFIYISKDNNSGNCFLLYFLHKYLAENTLILFLHSNHSFNHYYLNLLKVGKNLQNYKSTKNIIFYDLTKGDIDNVLTDTIKHITDSNTKCYILIDDLHSLFSLYDESVYKILAFLQTIIALSKRQNSLLTQIIITSFTNYSPQIYCQENVLDAFCNKMCDLKLHALTLKSGQTVEASGKLIVSYKNMDLSNIFSIPSEEQTALNKVQSFIYTVTERNLHLKIV